MLKAVTALILMVALAFLASAAPALATAIQTIRSL